MLEDLRMGCVKDGFWIIGGDDKESLMSMNAFSHYRLQFNFDAFFMSCIMDFVFSTNLNKKRVDPILFSLL